MLYQKFEITIEMDGDGDPSDALCGYIEDALDQALEFTAAKVRECEECVVSFSHQTKTIVVTQNAFDIDD